MMQVKSGLATNTIPQLSPALPVFIFRLVKDVVLHSLSFEKRKKQLKACCESEKINYDELEYNLNLFFSLLEDYRKTNNVVLFRFLKLQARYCFIDEARFNSLQIILPGQDNPAGTSHLEAYSSEIPDSSTCHGGIVGACLIGLT